MSRDLQLVEFYIPLIEWTNTKEFFWMKDIRSALGCLNSSDTDYPLNKRITHFIGMLRKNGAIQCVEVRKSERHYYRTRIVLLEDLSQPKKKSTK